MTLASVSLAQSPPLWVPARFFVTAPVFGVLAAVVLVWTGDAGLADRWTPAALAVTHLLTLGYMGMVMLGALMQVFPVVIGHPFRHAGLVSAVVHAGLTLGVVLLGAGLMAASHGLTAAAAALLGLTVLTYLAAAGATLTDVAVWGDTARAITLALAAFAVTAGLGVWLALGYAGLGAVPRAWTNLHAGWGLAGWVPLLVMGVAYQVVPMFQVTPGYPQTLRRALAPVLFAMLLASSAAHGLAWPDWLARLPQVAAGLTLVGFAAATLLLQHRRRRRRPDVTVDYWRVGLLCLMAAVALWTVAQLLPALRADARFALMLGVLMMPGFSLSMINGMLYKIVPFLVWLHLAMAPAGPARSPVDRAPSMKRIIGAKRARAQLWLHTLALVLLGGGCLGVPGALPAGGLVFALACGALGLDILSALRLYHATVRGAAAATTASPRAAE